MNINSQLPLISTFSGGGFLDMGFMNQGFQVQEAFEINEWFINAYNYGIDHYLNHTGKQGISQYNITHKAIAKSTDISSVDVQKFIGKQFKNVLGIIGGPPCQDYSVGGKNKGIEGDRGKLLYSYLSIIENARPSFIFFENVSGLFNTKSHQTAFFDLVKKLEKAGYTLWYDVLNALEYGVPQDRSRLVLVGFKNAIVKRLLRNGYKLVDENKYSDQLVFKWPSKRFPNAKNIKWPLEPRPFGNSETQNGNLPYNILTVENAFSQLNDLTPNQSEFFVPYSIKFNEIVEGDTNRKSFKRLHRKKYSPTVAYGNNEVHLHPTETRRLSVREALRLQSVDDLYVLPSEISLTQKFKLISNGVPTLKAELIAEQIRRTLALFIESGGKLDNYNYYL